MGRDRITAQDKTGRAGTSRDGTGWGETRQDGTGQDRTGPNEMGRDGTRRDRTEQEGAGRGGTGRDGGQRGVLFRARVNARLNTSPKSWLSENVDSQPNEQVHRLQ